VISKWRHRFLLGVALPNLRAGERRFIGNLHRSPSVVATDRFDGLNVAT
jgi:hypothetical protein